MNLEKSIKRISGALAAFLFTLAICLCTAHESSASHSDKNPSEHCEICAIHQASRAATLPAAPVLPQAIPVLLVGMSAVFPQQVFVDSFILGSLKARGPPHIPAALV